MTKHQVVQLDSLLQLPELDFEYEYISYPSTKSSEIAERIQHATIVIATGTRMTYDMIMSNGPKLQLLASLGVGHDHIDIEAVKKRGLTLVNVPAQNTDSVTEHAFALYSAVKKNVVHLHNTTIGGVEWLKNGTLIGSIKRTPKTNKEETLGVVGYGAIGKCTEKMAKALGMQVLVSERKGASDVREGRVLFEEVLKRSTVLVMTCPLDPSTRNMIDEAELKAMRDDAILVNVGRGGIVNELALANALKNYTIAGAATDVFETEPATEENCPLLDKTIPNLVLTPHMAWYSTGTIKGTQQVTKRNLELFVAGTPQNVIYSGSRNNS